jgi:hypothetical protein
MGSRKNRKENDQPIIRIPKASVLSVPNDSAEQAADICKVSFDVLITNKAFAIKNAAVELILKQNIYIVHLAGTEIAKLTEKQSEMVKKCAELGVKYKGNIVEHKSDVYARFIRTA